MVNDTEVPKTGSRNGHDALRRVVDPSDAVTGMGFIFGLVGAVMGIGAAIYLSPSIAWSLIGYCLLAALAGGSAGVVTGGMIGAAMAVLRGVTQSPMARRTVDLQDRSIPDNPQ
ncbi:hypothetical protein [Rhizobium sp. 18065]|uniref:hypothetical protein n=1 Tax=Rhizobium sp. 18065 TaxID=2681411 RepID=UPI001358CB20|nr:hypothetical protein [Rhizobium sp. 18065]